MTDLVPSDSTPIRPGAVEGLEDFGPTDAIMPMIRINHRRGVFVNNLTSQELPSLNSVILGLIKQRVLWPADISPDAKEPPLCRSYTYTEGHPNGDSFPWEESGFSKPETSIVLPCTSCKLKDWGSHPKRQAPWCSEQHTLAVLVVDDDGSMMPVIFAVQRSGLKPSRTYFSGFQASKQPPFTVYTTITLEEHKMGANPYFVPKFTRGERTDVAEHPQFSLYYRQIRDFVQTPWQADSDPGILDNEVSEPAAAASAPRTSPLGSTPAPAPSPAAAVIDEEDELPF